MPDDYVPQPDDPIAGNPIVFRPTTFAKHARAVDYVERENRAIYPRSGRGRTTRPSSGTWGYLASGHTISGASGLSLGGGTVQLCSRSDGALTADGDTVQVLNSGDAITGPAALELDWVDGAWAVCKCGPLATCSPCSIPPNDLALCWYNLISGSGSVPLIYDGAGHWNSACSNELLYSLSCPGGNVQFGVTYFLTGACPKGQQQSCTSPGRSPFSITLFAWNCSEPFLLDFRLTNATCVVLGDDGYRRFVVTDGACP